MPAKSARQQRFMAMCSHSPSKAKGKCPPKKVAQEFSHSPASYHHVSMNHSHNRRMKKAGGYVT